MKNDPGFVEHLLELLQPFADQGDEIVAKPMFGGHGVFRDGLMFGLIADSVFYLKCDSENLAEFEALELEPFAYETKNGTRGVMSYRRCPESAFANPREMEQWAGMARAAALRNQKPRKKKNSNSKSTSPKKRTNRKQS